MTTVNVQEAKTHPSRLLADVEGGTEVTIARAGRRWLVWCRFTRPLGVMSFAVPDDVDSPLSEDELAAWE